MNTWRKLIVEYNSISWILLVALLSLTIFPVTYHLHHDGHHVDSAEISSHNHAVDFHTAHDMVEVEMEYLDDGVHQVLTATPDSLVKKTSTQIFAVVFLAVMLALLPLMHYRKEQQSDYCNIVLPANPLLISPPLRAPPII